jgi:hypothetical protein
MVYCSNVLVTTPWVQKLCIPDTWKTNRPFQVLQEYHNVGIFALLEYYAALIGSCRSFGTNYRSVLLPDPSRRDIHRRRLFNSICSSSNCNAYSTHRSSQPPPFNDSFPLECKQRSSSLYDFPQARFTSFRFQYCPQHTVLKHFLLFLYSSLSLPRIYEPLTINVMRTAQITRLLIMHFSQA